MINQSGERDASTSSKEPRLVNLDPLLTNTLVRLDQLCAAIHSTARKDRLPRGPPVLAEWPRRLQFPGLRPLQKCSCCEIAACGGCRQEMTARMTRILGG